ncbi:MAG TPA: RNA polymerase sigma factor [Patescibacteria group bacterium]
MQNGSDEEVLALVSENEEFFGLLIRRYENRMLGYVRKITGGSTETAEDIVQNIFIKAYVNIYSFNKEQKFSSWLYGIAHNECIDYWRKNKKHSGVISLDTSEEIMAALKSEDDLFLGAQQQWDAQIIRRALDGVPNKYKEVLILRFLEDRSYEDIAQILKKPVSTVGTLVRRAKRIFAEKMKQEKI